MQEGQILYHKDKQLAFKLAIPSSGKARNKRAPKPQQKQPPPPFKNNVRIERIQKLTEVFSGKVFVTHL